MHFGGTPSHPVQTPTGLRAAPDTQRCPAHMSVLTLSKHPRWRPRSALTEVGTRLKMVNCLPGTCLANWGSDPVLFCHLHHMGIL